MELAVLNTKINGIVETEFTYKDWNVVWTGLKTHYGNLSLVGQWGAIVKGGGEGFYINVPGGFLGKWLPRMELDLSSCNGDITFATSASKCLHLVEAGRDVLLACLSSPNPESWEGLEKNHKLLGLWGGY